MVSSVIDLTGTFACKYCKNDFHNASALKRHTTRKSACISYADMEKMCANQQADIVELTVGWDACKNEVHNLKDALATSLKTVQELELELKKLRADRSMDELTKEVKVWQSISIVAPFLSDATKKSIKKVIKDIPDILAIRAYVNETYPNIRITRINKTKTVLEIVMEDEETVECKICFDHKAQPKGKCATCTTCQVCTLCESDLIQKNKSCPFCTSPFLNIKIK
jgi:hypothetical protein